MVLAIWIDDVDRSFAELTPAGAPGLEEPHDTGNNNRNALRFQDGNLAEIVAKRS